MSEMFWAVCMLLLVQVSLCSVEQTDKGCMRWTTHGDNVCCDACHPGHRLVNACGPNPQKLCTLCEPEKFAKNPKEYKCQRCTQCIGVQVLVERCTPYTDTKCGCKAGLTCGDDRCSFCVTTCDKGHEPEKRSCRPCPSGTFNDKIHQTCKPWSTKCPHPDQYIVAKGTALSDIKCANMSLPEKVQRPNKPDINGSEWNLVLTAVTSALLMTFGIIVIIIVIVTKKVWQKKNEKEDNEEEEEVKTPMTKTLIIRTPTDEPKTLIAVECSFHEAQQEQGGSSESIASKDSSDQLIA